MEKPKICHSKWGISHPGCFPDLSWINLDGTLNEPRVNYDSDVAKACGATMMRLLPCLVDDPALPRLPSVPENVRYNYTPWTYLETMNQWDLSSLESQYFANLKRICEILNGKGLSLIFSIYDRCHWDHGGRIPHSPWLWNVNGITTFWNTRNTKFNDEYEGRVLTALKGKDVYYELVNEPRQNNLNILVAFTGRLYTKLLAPRWGIPKNRIISGVEYFLDGKVSEIYEAWRKRLNFNDSRKEKEGIPDSEVGYRPIHNFLDVCEHRDVLDTQVHGGKEMISTDGNKITEAEIYKATTKFFSRKRPDQNESPRFIWEFLDQGVDRETGKRTEKYGSRGFARAFHDYFYPNEPEWYSMKIDLVDPSNPERPPDIKPPIKPPVIPPNKPKPDPVIEPEKKSTLMRRILIGGGIGLLGVILAMLHKPFKLPWIIMSLVAGVIGNIPWILEIYKQRRKHE